jgi:SAM-dependent methyltransferase
VVEDVWAEHEAYEAYIGRWSRRVAAQFVPWLGVPPRRRWLDVGCGTGSLAAAALALADPAAVVGVDPSLGFLIGANAGGDVGAHADGDAGVRAACCAGDALALPFPDGTFDAVVSGLALNFVPDPPRAVAELARVARPGAVVGAFVWDYADGMQMLRVFWSAASEVDPAAAALDEGRRFPLCRPEPLRALWRDAGMPVATIEAIDVPTVFADFDDYWRPFLGGQGPAPGFVAALAEDRRALLRELLRARLPARPDGAIRLTARAWAVRARV